VPSCSCLDSCCRYLNDAARARCLACGGLCLHAISSTSLGFRTGSSNLLPPLPPSPSPRNMEHMIKAHSFLIDEIEYLVDLEGLLAYLGDKVSTPRPCPAALACVHTLPLADTWAHAPAFVVDRMEAGVCGRVLANIRPPSPAFDNDALSSRARTLVPGAGASPTALTFSSLTPFCALRVVWAFASLTRAVAACPRVLLLRVQPPVRGRLRGAQAHD